MLLLRYVVNGNIFRYTPFIIWLLIYEHVNTKLNRLLPATPYLI